MEGIGSVNIWSFSRGIDFQDLDHIDSEQNVYNIKNPKTSVLDIDKSLEPFNVLSVGAGDIGSVVKTIARAWRHQRRKINIYMIEGQATILARHMLLLSIFLDVDADMSLQERTELFLELYGNVMLRDKTNEFLKQRANELMRVVTDETGPLSTVLDLSQLKYRERDDLEFTFKFWRNDKRSFEADKLWDFRLRKYYATRYDNQDNVVDWDYHMKFKDKLSTLNKHDFLRWRKYGISHEVRDSNYSKPNRAVATVDGLKEDNLTVSKWGYFSDVCVGPFLAWASDCEDKDMLKMQNDVMVKTTQQIAEHNVAAAFYELLTNSTYRPNDPSQLLNSHNSDASHQFSNFKIHFLPCDPALTFDIRRKKYEGKFDLVLFGGSLAHRVKDVYPLLKKTAHASVLVETAKFVMDINVHQQGAFIQKIIALAQSSSPACLTLHPSLSKKLKVCDGNWENVAETWEFVRFVLPIENGLANTKGKEKEEEEEVKRLTVKMKDLGVAQV